MTLLAVIFPVYPQARQERNAAAPTTASYMGPMAKQLSPDEGVAATTSTPLAGHAGINLQGDIRKREIVPLNDEHAPRSGYATDKPNAVVPSKLISPSVRRVIQSADLGVTVADPSKAETDATNLAKANGGYVFSSALDKDENDQPVAKVQLRVPVDKFETTVKQIKGFGKVTADHVTGEDVTVKIADTDARVHVMKAQEESYVQMLRGARRVDDALEIRARLDEVRETIESLSAQSSTLKDQAAMSTINATFSSKPKEAHPALLTQPHDWAKDTWTSAVNGFTDLVVEARD